jgi:hypothetical protein
MMAWAWINPSAMIIWHGKMNMKKLKIKVLIYINLMKNDVWRKQLISFDWEIGIAI